jgi:hypothetical protein
LKTILVYSDHGLMLGYFLHTELTKILTKNEIQLIFLVQPELVDLLETEYRKVKNVSFISSREELTNHYRLTHHARTQEIFEYLRGSSMSSAIPLSYVDIHRKRKEFEAKGRWKLLLISMRPFIWILRYSLLTRKLFRKIQNKLFTTDYFSDIFEKYHPHLVISPTSGWRLDRYFLREAKKHGIPSLMTVIGWDNPVSHGIPGADVDYANVWSQIHVKELSLGLDWPVERIKIGGMPLYDGYINNTWLLPRDQYFQEHNLDPEKKLITYIATALSISPNYHNIEVIVDLIKEKKLSMPAQLLIRLHPNHFKSQKHYQEECRRILELAKTCPDVHVVAPKAVGGGVPRYSGEDFPEKASMLAYSDVIVTIYSTMVLEAAIMDRPIISCCIDSEEGWPESFWLPLHEIPGLPTAKRVDKADAAVNVFSPEELIKTLDNYLQNPDLHRENRLKLAKQELTFLNGEATLRTADFLLSLLK